MEVASILLRCEDLDRSTTFWADQVGLEVAGRTPGFTFLDAGSITVVLRAADSVTDESLTEVVFESADIRKRFRAMADRGVPFDVELRTIMSNEGRDLLGAHFRDPDGHYGTLTGWVDAG